MKNKLYILTLIPLALSMTSFNIETQVERASIGSGSTPPDNLPEDDADNQDPAQRVDIGQLAGHVEDVLRRMNELTIDLDNNDKDDTRLKIVSVQPKETSSTSLSSRDNQDKIVLTIESRTDRNLEAVSGVDCECDNQQLIHLELTPNELGLTASSDLESLNQEKLTEILQAKSSVIIEKINQQRRSQHEERLAARDCSTKESDREQSECLLDRIKESSGDEKEELIAELEDNMRNLLYSEERSDERAFKALFKKLKGDEALRDLRARLQEHKDIKEEIDEYKETSTRFASDMREFDLMYQNNLNTITDIERSGFNHPRDWQNYQLALQNMDYAQNMSLGAQSELDTMTRSFRTDFDRITRDSHLLRPQDIQFARNYAFPRSTLNSRGRVRSRGRRSVRGRTAISQLPLGTRPVKDLYTGLEGDLYYNNNLQGTSGRFNSRSSRGPIGQFSSRRGSMRGRNIDRYRYQGSRTLARPRSSLGIDRRQMQGRGTRGRRF